MHAETLQGRTVARGLIGFSGTRGMIDGIGCPSQCRRDGGAVGGGGAAARMALGAALLAAVLLAGCVAGTDDDSVADDRTSGVESTRDAGPRVALVIGNARYKSSSIGRLENPERDAKSVAQALDRVGFDVEVERNLAEGAFHNALKAFREKSRRAATAAFYYAGHGMEEGGVNYLIPVDMESPKATHDAVELGEVIGAMQGQRNLVFLDACRTPPGRGLRGDSDSPLRRGLAAVALRRETDDDILISYAAPPKNPALDGEKGGNSPYAAALAEHMVVPGLRLADMLMRVRNTVQGATDREQKPWRSGSLGAPFYFVPGMPSVPDWESAWEQVEGIQDPAKVDQVRAYIREYRGEPRAARWVAIARELADKLEELAKPPLPQFGNGGVATAGGGPAGVDPEPPGATGGGTGVPGGGARAPRPGSVWESPLGMEFAWVPAGRFVMGSPEGLGRDDRQHEVRISQGFWMYVVARLAVFKDTRLAEARTDLAIHSRRAQPAVGPPFLSVDTLWRDKAQRAWMDPAAEDVWAYNAAITADVFRAGVDEVNLDYIRFPTDGDLHDMHFAVRRAAMSRREVLRAFFAYFRRQFPGQCLSADLFGLVTVARDDLGIGQVLEDAAPYFDFLCPMVYPSHYARGFRGFRKPAEHPYEVVHHALAAARERLEAFGADSSNSARLRPWLQDFHLGALYDAEMVRDQIEATREALCEEYGGFLLWNARNVYTAEALK